MKYTIETHCHSNPVSGCSRLKAEELVKGYKEKGYDAILLTNHFTPDYFRSNTVDNFLKDYYDAKNEGEKIGIRVLLGAEYRFEGCINDYLLFGTTEEFLREAVNKFSSSVRDFHTFCNENGVLFFQAHPFRSGMVMISPRDLDGIETHNCAPWHDSRNAVAAVYAKIYNLKEVSGSDAHMPEHIGRGGILSDTLPGTSAELRDIINSGKYEHKITE